MAGKITSKERVMAAINHDTADRVPIDYCAVEEVTERLKKHFKVNDHDELLERLNVDFRQVRVNTAVKSDEKGYTDVWGIERRVFVEKQIRFQEVVKPPLEAFTTIREVNEYPWPDARRIDYSKLAEQFDRYRDYAIISGPWAPLFCQLMDLVGIEKAMMDMALEPELIEEIIGKIVDFNFEVAYRMFEIGKGKIDIFYTGDDFASQKGLMISKEMFRRFFKPGLSKLYSLARDYGLKVMMHSCGAIVELIPEFIEMGVDIIDPVQVRADGMDISFLKKTFGDKVCFHGAIDQQHLLPFGSEEEVREAVRKARKILGESGGYILCSSHDLLDNIPTSNILAMYDEALR